MEPNANKIVRPFICSSFIENSELERSGVHTDVNAYDRVNLYGDWPLL